MTVKTGYYCEHTDSEDHLFCVDCGQCREDLDSEDRCIPCGGIDENEEVQS